MIEIKGLNKVFRFPASGERRICSYYGAVRVW